MPPSDQGRYKPPDVARLLGLPIEVVQIVAPDLPRFWNLSTGEWWVTEEQLEGWRRYFVKPPEIPTYRTRTL